MITVIGGFLGWTAVTFSFSVAGQINTTEPYIYDVAIAASSDAHPLPQFAPLPVITGNNPNGRMAGCPTHFVEFNSLQPSAQYPFTLYRFASNPKNRLNPTDLSQFAPTTRGVISEFEKLKKGGSVLTFTLYTNMLADTDQQARKL